MSGNDYSHKKRIAYKMLYQVEDHYFVAEEDLLQYKAFLTR